MKIDQVKTHLKENPKRWLVTGVAGFIGSNLLEALLSLGQTVVGIDNFSTGYLKNLRDVQKQVDKEAWDRFTFIEGDIRDLVSCYKVCGGVDYVLHHAALGSVPRSIDDPIETNSSNIDGFVNLLVAAKDLGLKRFVYASSSAVYGDDPEIPKVEEKVGTPLSPYAVTKYANELYADVFARIYDLEVVGLRYFNVFGKRQDPNGAYAAVIPKWIDAFLRNERPMIHGDGETSRDFCYIDNVIQANLLAATTDNFGAINKVYNIAYGNCITLNELFHTIKNILTFFKPEIDWIEPVYGPFRKGDVQHSLADISAARKLLSYNPRFDISEGLKESVVWYLKSLGETTPVVYIYSKRRGHLR